MEKINSYKDLLIWQRGMLIAEQVYELTQSFPSSEVYGITSQLRRAGVSIPSNIAEGFGRNATKSYINFIKIARGSLNELETQLILADRLNFTTNPDAFETLLKHIDEEGKMINSFINKLEEKYRMAAGTIA